MGGGITQKLLDRIQALEDELQSVKYELALSGIDLEALKASRATPSAYGLAKISESTSVTETSAGLVLSAKEKNPAVPGSMARKMSTLQSGIDDLRISRIANANIKDIAEIFSYRTGELALFCNWGQSSLCPVNYSMVLRIPNYDTRGAKCLCLHNVAVWVGELTFATKTISWTRLGA